MIFAFTFIPLAVSTQLRHVSPILLKTKLVKLHRSKYAK